MLPLSGSTSANTGSRSQCSTTCAVATCVMAGTTTLSPRTRRLQSATNAGRRYNCQRRSHALSRCGGEIRLELLRHLTVDEDPGLHDALDCGRFFRPVSACRREWVFPTWSLSDGVGDANCLPLSTASQQAKQISMTRNTSLAVTFGSRRARMASMKSGRRFPFS